MPYNTTDKDDLYNQVRTTIADDGVYNDGRHKILLSADSPEIWVRDVRTEALVAYSSTRADWDSSLDEFIWDYFVADGGKQ